mmetsp:Transcript_49387/g.56715  ORF Transcript_49387/g.56715 Transcript_49387/m.56715 type:complete len:145 (+) Transcript_49387:37-471(+)|eukprot:CAMPEP_0115015262 /NCGR_PEP_ID=MMETSP0216-20121206/26649_1 /TAXON_ID=223996 /ORGANISM="Protocruzia adherens, Strain Boccale" /LENGTH=144 /DNA_ID=CAMNT_0002385319 /DNA_START=37 /DNA_END=471 /DNA_ORIENTATION=+
MADSWGSGDVERPKHEVKSGWGTGPVSNQPLIDTSQGSKKKNNHWDEKAEEIQLIPEIDDTGEEDFQKQVASVPNVVSNKVQALEALNQDLKKHIPNNPEPGVDLTLLTTCMRPYNEVFETDDAWEYHTLQTEISLAIREELEG